MSSFTIKTFSMRFVFLLSGLIFGFALGFILAVIWLTIKGFMLGYGDSGPDWVNTVSDGIQIVSIIFSLLMSQLLFNYLKKKGTIKSN